ncbi:DUF2637 domain-containing protein [Streptomyces sp. ME02-8801-2C]|uniref:DUF2637 domain-containing protein n=1 Tax=Streptomyces sp. ME02-8801-2C TaxID=3028680 RepID=UPI0029AA646E|nr:DUF2637 domain-containing protein [Streptomyces sp. ME02-8801-2C]MDX3455408.1 DUF2637 domain-containing protein [Streptomyces sp. ME02-8801-2C]
MNRDYANPSFVSREWQPSTYSYGSGADRHGSPDDSLHSGVPLTPPDSAWDPVEELAYLLQEAVPAEQVSVVPPPHSEPSSDVNFAEPMKNLAQITAQLPPIRRSSAGHRKMGAGNLRLAWLQTGSFVIVAFVAVIVAMVSVFGGMAAYGPLQNIATGTKSEMIPQWPLLVYGPWMVASLSILRTALHRRRALHSWFIVLLFSFVAIMLCVAQADRTVTAMAGAALPAVASLACFQQLVRQITLTLPPRKTPRHRQ